MIDAQYVLSKLRIRPTDSVNAAVRQVRDVLEESSDKLMAANKIIVSLGSRPVTNIVMSDILAKALVEQALIQGEKFNPEKAAAAAMDKYNWIAQKHPYIFAGTEQSSSSSEFSGLVGGIKSSKRGTDKKTQAHAIYMREKEKKTAEIAKIISEEMDITYANAYYYVSRVFKEKN